VGAIMCLKEMCLGFLFNEDLKKVALIEKKRPAWQYGLYNGIGGHLEDDETPSEGMCREFMEETGLALREFIWKKFATMDGGGEWYVHVYCATVPGNYLDVIKSTTDECIKICNVEDVFNGRVKVVHNLIALVSLAINFLNGQVEFVEMTFRSDENRDEIEFHSEIDNPTIRW
jgi:8-oxo-dGTP diphosphatase